MAHEVTTTDLSRFGFREIRILRDILDQWVKSGLPDDFTNDEVRPMMNMMSGNVFLTIVSLKLPCSMAASSNLSTPAPYAGHEGFFENLLPVYDQMDGEDREWLRDLAERLGREDEVPKKWVPNQFRYVINLDERGEFSAEFYRINVETGEDEEEPYQHIDTSDAQQLSEEGVDFRDGQAVMDYYNDLNPDSAVEVYAVLEQGQLATIED